MFPIKSVVKKKIVYNDWVTEISLRTKKGVRQFNRNGGKIVNIAIVGAGHGGTNLMKVLETLADIKINLVVDTSSNADGILYAKKKGIATENDIKNIGKYPVDVIIEATGSSHVIGQLKALYCDSHQIIDAQIAQVLNQMVDGQVVLLEKMSAQMASVNNLANTFSKEFVQLIDSVENIRGLSEHLNLAVKKSSQYIDKTGEITDSVNKIAMQTKILGLNANIEAARAGEHGKGFAVVANEVQKLSDSTTQFATEISNLLKELSSEIEKVSHAANQLNGVSSNQNSTALVMQSAIKDLENVL